MKSGKKITIKIISKQKEKTKHEKRIKVKDVQGKGIQKLLKKEETRLNL